jgi:hypothetical protein
VNPTVSIWRINHSSFLSPSLYNLDVVWLVERKKKGYANARPNPAFLSLSLYSLSLILSVIRVFINSVDIGADLVCKSAINLMESNVKMTKNISLRNVSRIMGEQNQALA